MKVARLIFLFIFLYTLGCQEEETIPRTYPVVNTLETTEINTLGAVFNAEITSGNLTDIIEHGFVWSADKNNPVTLETGDLVKLGKPENQLIAAKINSTLENNKEYLVRSYVQTSDKIIYGKIVKFFSLGSFGPTLLNAIPLEARAQDTVMLLGKNFSYRISENIVKFENLESKVLDATDTSLKVVIPDMVNAVQPKVTLDIKANRSTLNRAFKIKAPEIISLSPENPILCDTIYIRGNNFLPVKQGNRVLMGGVEARITEVVSREEIRVLAPYSPNKLETVKLISGGFEVNSVTNLNQVVPEVIGEAVINNSVLTINGNNFPYCYDDMIVQLLTCEGSSCGGFIPEILSFSRTKIELKFPSMVQCLTPTLILKFLSGDDLIYEIKNLKYNLPKVLSVSKTSATFSEEVVINVKDFYEGSLTDLQVYIGSFNAPIVSKSDTKIVCKIGTGAMVKSNGLMDVDVFYCKDKATFPDAIALKQPVINNVNPKIVTSRFDQIVITGDYFNPEYNAVQIGDKFVQDIYIQFSKTQITLMNINEIINDIYVSQTATYPLSVSTGGYKVFSNTPITLDYQSLWTSEPDLPFEGRDGAVSFTINGKGYVVSGYNESGFLQDVWQFDPLTNIWTKKANFPGTGRKNAQVLVLNNKAYVGLGNNGYYDHHYKDWYEYNPVSDTWIKKADYPGNLPNGSFQINNMGYVVGNNEFLTELTDFWEYNPSINQWTEKKKLPGIVSKFMYSVNGLGHVYASYTHYTYNPLMDEWKVLDYFIPPFAYSVNSYITIDNSIYVLQYNSAIPELYEFKPLTNEWSSLPYRGQKRSYPIMFNVGNLIYLGSGRYEDPPNPLEFLRDFWKIDPTKSNP